MPKKEQKINLELVQKQREGELVSVLSLGKQEIGFIKQDDKSFEAHTFDSQQSTKFKSLDDAINDLIMNFNLHQNS